MNKIISQALDFFRTNFFAILILTLLIEFPFIVITHLEKSTTILSKIPSWIFFADIGYIFLGIPVAMGAHARLYYQIIHGSGFNLKECIREVKKYFHPLVIASLFYIVLLMAGLLLFIIPGLIISARLSMFPFFIMYEGLNPFEALKKSVTVTRHYLWELVIPVAVLNLLFLTIQYATPFVFPGTGIQIYVIMVIIDLLVALFGWISFIIPFRVYCLYRSTLTKKTI